MTRDQIIKAVSRGWTHPETEHLTMDETLAHAIVEEIMKVDNQPNLGCATTELLIAELLSRARIASIAGETWPSYRTIDAI